MALVRTELERLADHVNADTEAVARRLEGIDSRMTASQVANQDLARSIFETLGHVQGATRRVADQAREFAALQDLLRAPKARGGIGEAMLAELLRQVLPPASYEMQHRFATGVVVDAVVKAGGRLVCIDSKFPLSSHQRMCVAETDGERASAERDFARDVLSHIKAIASRYIVPDEGTFDFAVMYVPAEGVYAEVLRLSHAGRPLYEAAMEARVIPMSPLTMYGYLQTVLFGLKCLRIEESARSILDHCGRLQQDMGRFASEYETLGHHLRNAAGKYDEGARRLQRLRGDLERVAELDEGGDDERPPLEAVND